MPQWIRLLNRNGVKINDNSDKTEEKKNRHRNRNRHKTKHKNKDKTQQHTKLQPLGEILENRFSFRVQLVVGQQNECIKFYTESVKNLPLHSQSQANNVRSELGL